MAVAPSPTGQPPAKVDELREWNERQHMKAACGFCDFVVEGTFAETRAAFAEHRRTEHADLPEPAPRFRRRR